MCLAVPGKILSVSGDEPLRRMGRVSFGGIVKDVSLAYVPDAGVDDYVIVHAGFAISQLDGSPHPLSAAAGVAIAAVVVLGLLFLAVFLWSRI